MPNNFHFMGVKSSFGCTTQHRDELMDTLMISTSSVEMKVCTYITHLMPLLELMNLWISHDENHLKIYDAIVRKRVFPSRKMSVKLLKCIHMWKVFDILMAWLAYRPVENTVSWVRHSQGLISADYCQASSRKKVLFACLSTCLTTNIESMARKSLSDLWLKRERKKSLFGHQKSRSIKNH
jgi:hypothetical protein